MEKTSSKKMDAYVLNQLAYRYKLYKDELKVADKRIGTACAEELKERIIENYADFCSKMEAAGDPQERGDIVVWVEEETPGRYSIGATGEQVIYDEFGTGENGMLFPHPLKSQYDLEPYNSGPTIRTDQYGMHYWVYNDRVTYGVPSGQFMYKAVRELADRRANEIAVEDLIKAFNRAMKG